MKRYVRLTYEYPQGASVSDGPPPGYEQERLEPFKISNELHIGTAPQAHRFAPVGKCIYCGSTSYQPNSAQRLSDEHIVPEGLGARLILPEASCRSCCDLTRSFEAPLLRTLLWEPRKKLGIKGKNRKREKVLDFPVAIPGTPEPVRLPLNLHPTMLFLAILNPPGILINRAPELHGIQSLWSLELSNPTYMIQNVSRKFCTPTFDTLRFCQLLAKIAHGFAVATFGLSGFDPVLNDLIRSRFARTDSFPQCFHFVGGTPEDYAPSDSLHTLGWAAARVGDQTYLIVGIRLFANQGAPVYWVVVGTPTATTKLHFTGEEF